jgi:adenylate kinase
VIFLGPPGAGKGTQAARLAAHLGVPKIGTGEMLRAAIAKKTPLGRQVHPFVEAGSLVPDPLLVALVRERIADPDCGRGFVLDGFPRTLPQARGAIPTRGSCSTSRSRALC